MKNILYRSRKIGKYEAKCFKYSETMHTFLNKGGNALHWNIATENMQENGLNKKGHYFSQSGRNGEFKYINMRELDN